MFTERPEASIFDDLVADAVAAGEAALLEAHRAAWSPPSRLSLSEWADEYRVLSSESTSEHGRWHTDRVEYFREVMDAITSDDTEEITVMKSAQVGYTEAIILNLVGYYVHQDPCPVLVQMPTLNIGTAFSKDRLDPMVRDSEQLTGKLTGTGALHKMFPGGHVTIAGANSPSSLASRPIRILLSDEVDRFPESAGEEGDPLALADKRTTTFWNRKKVRGGTPTVKGQSRTEELFEAGTMEYYHVPCPHCGTKQRLIWSQVRWEKRRDDKNKEHHLPETAVYECAHCQKSIDDAQIDEAVLHGEWVATHPERGLKHRSFHICEFYSRWVKLSETVEAFLRAKNDTNLLRVWVNTALGETYEVEGKSVDHTGLFMRREVYAAPLPAGVRAVTAGVDVQDDRLEVEIVGWNQELESWSIDYRVFSGNPANDELWDSLDSCLLEIWEHESGGRLAIDAMAIDTGGHHTTKAYEFAKARWERRVYACKGVGGFGKLVVGRPSRKNKVGVRLFPLGVDGIKQEFYTWLMTSTEPGPGFCHFPLLPHYDNEHFRRLVSEKMVTTFKFGKSKTEWVKMIPRNEQLDCRVLARAALAIMNPAWHSFEERITRGGIFIEPSQAATGMQAQQSTRRSRGRRQISRGIG